MLRGDARSRKPCLLWLQFRWPDEPFRTAPRGEVHRRNVEDSYSALQEIQARLAAETKERDHVSRVGDELDKRIVLQMLLGESPATASLRCLRPLDIEARERIVFSCLSAFDHLEFRGVSPRVWR